MRSSRVHRDPAYISVRGQKLAATSLTPNPSLTARGTHCPRMGQDISSSTLVKYDGETDMKTIILALCLAAVCASAAFAQPAPSATLRVSGPTWARMLNGEAG